MELAIKTADLSYNQVFGIVEHLAPWMARQRFHWMRAAAFSSESRSIDPDDMTIYPDLDQVWFGRTTAYGFRLPAHIFVTTEGRLLYTASTVVEVDPKIRRRILQRVTRAELQALVDDVIANTPRS